MFRGAINNGVTNGIRSILRALSFFLVRVNVVGEGCGGVCALPAIVADHCLQACHSAE